MGHKLFLVSFLLLALSSMHNRVNAVDYVVEDRSGNSKGGNRFRSEIGGVDYARQALTDATNFIWKLLLLNDPSDRKPQDLIVLRIQNGDGVAAVSGNSMSVKADYLGNFKGDVKREFTGIIYHETTHIWQWDGNHRAPSWVIEGVADFVRLKAGYAPDSWVKPGQGDRWDQRSDVTARFFDYCNGLRNGFVADLNKKMRDAYSDGFFGELLSKPVDQLWRDYKAQYGSN